LVYEFSFVVDTMKYILGDEFVDRVYFYDPRVLCWANEALIVGPLYFSCVDNISREAAAAIRSLFMPYRGVLPFPTLRRNKSLARGARCCRHARRWF